MNPQSSTREKTEIMGLLRQNKEKKKALFNQLVLFFGENYSKNKEFSLYYE